MHVKTREEWEAERGELLESVREFARVMKKAPFRNREGLRGVSAFAFYWFLRRMNPTVVFEVGVWRGFSTWLIEQAVPRAEIYCFDPVFMLAGYLHPWKVGRTYRSPRARYSSQDFSCADVGALAAKHARPLAFFDDHQNKLARLMQSRAAGIRDVIFDDNIAGLDTHRSLEDERRDPDGRVRLERELETYEIFPALWPVDFQHGGLDIREEGMGFPIDRELRSIYDERKWHSSLTYVRLR